MAYVHVAHDCHVGSDTIFGPHATLGGHVGVEDFANISAGSAVHQFCRVGQLRLHRRLFGRDQGCAAVRRGRSAAARRASSASTRSACRAAASRRTRSLSCKQAYRYLLQSKLNTTRALAQIEQDESLTSPEVRYLVEFIRTLAARRHPAARRRAASPRSSVADE